MWHVLLLTLIFSAACYAKPLAKCGKSFNETAPNIERIVHGVEAKQGAWPWIVPLMKYGIHKCGGSIISDRWIVTAAHCFPMEDYEEETAYPKEWSIEVGEHEVYTDGDNVRYQSVLHDVELVVKHKSFDQYHESVPADIALIKLKNPIRFNARVQPVCLPDKDEEFDEYEPSCYAAGWGEDFNTAQNMFALQEIHSEIVNTEICSMVYEDVIQLKTQICFGDGRKGTCMGDSGGPLMCKRRGRWILAGATSWGNEECQTLPGVFTRIAAYRDWIDEQMHAYAG